MTAQEQFDAEFFTRIDEPNAKWFIDRRNKKLFAEHSEVQAFLSELQIPFPTHNNTLFWTIVYFARRLIFPKDEKLSAHLKVWAEQNGMRVFVSKPTSLKRPFITTPQGKTYIMPVELYWTPSQFSKPTQPNVAEAANQIGGELIIDEGEEETAA